MSSAVNKEKKFKGFVAVHIGAGYHSPANSELYKQVCKQACLQAIQLLRDKKSALEAVSAAVVTLEDSQWTNAGIGSNLSLAGTVECDASIMDGHSKHYGAVGALSGVRNPILVAESLLRTQMQGELSLGRIPPSTVVAHGAYDWAVRHGIPTIPLHELITDSSRKTYIKNKRKLEIFEEGINGIQSSTKFRKIDRENQRVMACNSVSSSNYTSVVRPLHNTVDGAQCTGQSTLRDNQSCSGLKSLSYVGPPVCDKNESDSMETNTQANIRNCAESTASVGSSSDERLSAGTGAKCIAGTSSSSEASLCARSKLSAKNNTRISSVRSACSEIDKPLNISIGTSLHHTLCPDEQCFNSPQSSKEVVEARSTNNAISVVTCDNNIEISASNPAQDHRHCEILSSHSIIVSPTTVDDMTAATATDAVTANDDDTVPADNYDEDEDIRNDTVGAICVDDEGNIASAVSSGGIILKQPGRLGQAALYGCGCWAETDVRGKVGVGVSTSGCGEQLSKTIFARTCADCLKDQSDSSQALYTCFTKKFLESPYMFNEKQPLGGAVVVTVDANDTDRDGLNVEVLWAHTTDSMCLAYMSSQDHQPKAFVSRLPPGSRAGRSVVVQSKAYTVTS